MNPINARYLPQSMTVPALTLLTTVFGYPAFRGQQAEIIEHVAAGVEGQVQRGELDLVYVAPERLLTDRCLPVHESSTLRPLATREALRVTVSTCRKCTLASIA